VSTPDPPTSPAAPDNAAGLFAAKGEALPGCSDQRVKRASGSGAPAGLADAARTTGHDPDGAQDEAQDGTPDKTQDGGAASVLSIDLRATLVSEPSPPRAPAASPAASPAAAPAAAPVVTPARPRGGMSVGALVAAGAAVVAVAAIGVAAVLFYAFGPQPRGEATVAQAPAVAAPAETAADQPQSVPAEQEPAPQDRAGADDEGETSAAPADEPSADAAEPEAADENGALPSFDLVRVEPDGAAVIAGRAAPYAELILLHNGEPIGKATADWAGEWAFVTDRPFAAERHTITILVNDPDAEITLPEGTDPPARLSESDSAPSR
jgi:hypothetical protein